MSAVTPSQKPFHWSGRTGLWLIQVTLKTFHTLFVRIKKQRRVPTKTGKSSAFLILLAGPMRIPSSSQLKILVRQAYKYALTHTKLSDPFPGTAKEQNESPHKGKAQDRTAREGTVSERATVWELNDRQEKKGTGQVNIQAMLLDV